MEEQKQPTLLEKVQAWLESEDQDYSTGLALLSQVSKNRHLHMRLSRKAWPKKLVYELNKFVLANTNTKAMIAYKEQDPGEEEEEETTEKTEDNEKTKSDADAAKIIDQAKQEAEDITSEAEDTAEQTKEQAEEDAAEILSEAEKEADAILAKAGDTAHRKIIKGDKEVKYEDLPKSLQVLYDENTISYKKLRSLHEKLKLMKDATDLEREPICKEMADLDTIIQTNWKVIDEWDGKPIDEEAPAAVSGKDINAARSYISRYKERLVEGSEDRDKYLPKVQQRVNLLLEAGEILEEETKKELTAYGIQL